MILLVSLVWMWVMNEPTIEKPVMSELINDIKDGKVSELNLSDNTALVTYADGTKGEVEISIPILYEHARDDIDAQIKAGTLKVDTPEPESMPWWLSMLPTLFMVVIAILFWVFFIQQSQGGRGINSFGKSRAKVMQDDKVKVTFDDVAGADEEKKELEEVVEFLKAPKKFIELGARIPKGVLLVGPPGTGKTLLAKAVAGEAGVPFFSLSGSDFVEMFVGVGASRVRDLFEQAKKNLPAIIFIDEIDAVGRHRGAGLGGGHDEREQTLNQLLVEMDGFTENEGIIIIAATNRPDILDPALLRPGRFDRQVVVNTPDQTGREAILRVHSKNKPLDETVSVENIAKMTYGFTGADLENLLNESAILAARRGKKKIGMEEIDEAMLKVVMGTEKKTNKFTEQEKKQTAFHEAGHAVVAKLLPTQDPVHQVSIIPRGMAGGFTLSRPDRDKYYISKEEMLDGIVMAMGGRAAESIIFGIITTGASGDIEQATQTARNMVMKYGMSDKLGYVAFGSGQQEVFIGRDLTQSRNYSEAIAAQIDEEIRRIIDESYEKCVKLLNDNLDRLDSVANTLLEKEKLDNKEFLDAFYCREGEKEEKNTANLPIEEQE